MLRLILIAGVWLLITGTTVVKCSSGSDFRFDDENRAPVAADGFYQTPSSSSLTGRMSATDPDDDELTYSIVTSPDLGNLRTFDSRTGFFTYMPAQIGSDQFSFRVSDGRLSSNTAIVNIVVTLQTADASGTTSPPLAAVHADPLDPGALLLLWGAPASRIEKLSVDGRHRQVLATDIVSLTVFPQASGRLQATGLDGAPRVSVDGGLRWQPARDAAPVVDLVRDAYAGPMLTEPRTILASVTDPFATDTRLVVKDLGSHGEVWRVAADGSGWSSLSAVLSGPLHGAGLMADPRVPARWVMRLDQDAGTRILTSRDGGVQWEEQAVLLERGARLLDCMPAVCVLSEDRHRLWRLIRIASAD